MGIKVIRFVCYLGKQRGPTAADVFNELLKLDELYYNEYHAEHGSIRFNSKVNGKILKEDYRVIALNKRAKKNLEKHYGKILAEKLLFFPLPAWRRRNSKDLVEKVTAYYESKKWM